MWASVSVGDPNKGNTNKVVQTNEYVSLPFPCSDSTDCTYYSVTLESGRYDFEVWGAQGGNDTTYPDTCFGGRGGYSKGTVQLNSKTTLYVYVGGSGTGSTSGSTYGSAGGGGGTDIRLQNGLWNDANGLKSRIIVAGGGGGRVGQNYEQIEGFIGNDGGGTTAPSYTISRYSANVNGATQTSSGSYTGGCGGSYNAAGSFGYANPTAQSNSKSKEGYNGGARGSDNWGSGGGGGGWWGGYTLCPTGAGGSGFVYTTSNSQCSAPSNYYLSNAATYSGNTNFLSPYGGYETGHRGNGFARITTLYVAPTPTASIDYFRFYNQFYSYCVNRRRNVFIPLISLFIFSLIEDGISFNLLPSFKFE
jgi:hypothetical protein